MPDMADVDWNAMQAQFLLNGPQLAAVQMAVKNRVSLIRGPPGTGKSQTAACLHEIFAARQRAVLVTAASNQAVDSLLFRMLQCGPARESDIVRYFAWNTFKKLQVDSTEQYGFLFFSSARVSLFKVL